MKVALSGQNNHLGIFQQGSVRGPNAVLWSGGRCEQLAAATPAEAKGWVHYLGAGDVNRASIVSAIECLGRLL